VATNSPNFSTVSTHTPIVCVCLKTFGSFSRFSETVSGMGTRNLLKRNMVSVNRFKPFQNRSGEKAFQEPFQRVKKTGGLKRFSVINKAAGR
jgi:hypothetical protein